MDLEELEAIPREVMEFPEIREEVGTQVMSRNARKPVFGCSDQAGHKPACTVTEAGYNIAISVLRRSGIVLSV